MPQMLQQQIVGSEQSSRYEGNDWLLATGSAERAKLNGNHISLRNQKVMQTAALNICNQVKIHPR